MRRARSTRFPLLAGGIAFAMHAWPATAQPLPQMLSTVYASHPALLAARAQLRATDEGVPQALSGWRPTVTVTGGYGSNDSRNRSRFPGQDGVDSSFFQDRVVGPANAAVVLNQSLYQGGRTVAATRRAETAVIAQRARLLGTEQQVLFDAVSAYVGVLRDVEVLRLNMENVAVMEQQQAATLRRYGAGEVTRTDALQSEARLATALGGREAARGALEASRAVFVRAVGQAPGPLTAPQPLRPVAPTLDALRSAAAAENPAVVAALFDERSARHAIDLQFSQLLPQLSVQGQAFRNDNSGARGSRSTGSSITATLSAPLYQGGAEYSAVRQARETAQQARRLLEDQRRVAVQQGVQAWEGLRAARAQTETTRRAIAALQGALDGVQREALLGGRTTIEVLNADLELLNARITLVQTAANVVLTSYAMAAAVGRLTAFDLNLPVVSYDWNTNYRAVRDRWAGLGD